MVNDGDFVLIEYTARVKETGNVIDTTDPEIAKKYGIYEEGQVYGPMLVVVGRKWVVEGLEEALREMEPGEERDVEVPPEKGYGVRDPSKIRVINIREFRRRGLTPRPGEIVEIGGNRGVIRSVTGNRVIVDFNHPLAGKTLIFHVKIVKKLEDLREKLEALAARYFSVAIGEIPVEYREEDRSVVVYIPTRIMTRNGIQYSKIAYATTVYEIFRDKVDRVVFIEAIEFRKPGAGGEKEKGVEEKEGEEEAVAEEKQEAVEKAAEAAETGAGESA